MARSAEDDLQQRLVSASACGSLCAVSSDAPDCKDLYSALFDTISAVFQRLHGSGLELVKIVANKTLFK